ncbi:hypothetical protein [Branchiibius cervicis]|uniref:NAD-glutamate dehydrogenase N-terminal ACT1 domain-containing protein n=1 Tax=Branchiibius cervicis TaxID=908252 RepID=A0ABW2AV79_9MICO
MPAVNSATVSESDELVSSYFEHTSAEDFQTLSPPDVSGIVRSHLALAAVRSPGTANVAVFTPHPDEDGWGRGLVVAQIVTDDTPFIVDTVLAALSRAQRSVRLLVHPGSTYVDRPAARWSRLPVPRASRPRATRSGSPGCTSSSPAGAPPPTTRSLRTS